MQEDERADPSAGGTGGFETVVKLARALKVDVADLVGGLQKVKGRS